MILFLLSLLIGTILPITLALGITMPFSGVLIRYRANYTPKRGLHLEDEGFHETLAETDSYFGMMRRVHRLEGWAGLYKGIMPSIIATLIAMVALSPFAIFLSMGHKVLPGGRVVIPTPSGLVLWILSFALTVIPALLVIPMQIITNRAITTPHKLSAFAPKAALHLLLSPAERAHPWKLYFAPGVGLSEFLQGLVSPTLALLLRFVPGLYLSHRLPVLLASLPVIALMTLLLTPLQVMGARLTLQRLDAAASADDALDAAPPAYGEEVMEFRTQQAPYTGLLDCGRQMVEEEGWRALLRAWWVTPFFMVTSVVLSTAS
ncbi:mitochondrial carrier [Mycena olivaceomarginata]|nr:mitochondrial carrier [Mycena olivaceomarginata]